MNVQLLVCLRCGGPLGKALTVPAIVECNFCNAVMSVGQGAPVVTRESTVDAKRDADRKSAREAFIAAVNEMAKAGRDPFEALCEAAAKYVGAAGQAETLARIVFAIAVDFEVASSTSIRRDGLALNRIAETYLRSLEELRTAPTTEMNLPYLTANETGPKHLMRVLSPAILEELAHRDPDAPPPVVAAPPIASEPPPEPAAPPKKKKRFWLF